MLFLVAGIDEFKGQWQNGAQISTNQLSVLRQTTSIESFGSSTRIAGSRLKDDDIERLVGTPRANSYSSDDEQQVAGVAHVAETVHSAWREMEIDEALLLRLHSDLLRYSTKNEGHRGAWKTENDPAKPFDPEGKELGAVFDAASPKETPELIDQLIVWIRREEALMTIHPLLRIAIFKVVLLAIQPFQSGNGLVSRIVMNSMLLRAGYHHASFSSLESIIEHSRVGYYGALRRTQISFRGQQVNWEPWILFFLRSMKLQAEKLRERLPERSNPASHSDAETPTDLSPLAAKLLVLLWEQKTLSIKEAAEALGANRNTLKGKFGELVESRFAEMRGKGRGAYYRSSGNQVPPQIRA